MTITWIFKNLFNDISGNKRQGSHAELPKEENLDVEVDIYITELSALLKLIQVRLHSDTARCIDVSSSLNSVNYMVTFAVLSGWSSVDVGNNCRQAPQKCVW